MKNFVVNLDRQPEKYERFLKRNAGCGIAFERFSACDGSQMSDQEVMAMRIVAPGTRFTKGVVGCAASIWHIWKWVAEQNESALVFEDDAAIRHDINAQLAALLPTLKNFDFLTLAYNTDSILDLELAPGLNTTMTFRPRYPTDQDEAAFQGSKSQVAAFRLNYSFGPGGYVISPVGARKMLQLCYPMDNRHVQIPGIGPSTAFGLDCMMNESYRLIKAYACFAPLVLPRNDKTISTTYTGDARTWG